MWAAARTLLTTLVRPRRDRRRHFLRGAGITVLEGWGLTETTAGVTLNLPGAPRRGLPAFAAVI